MSKTMKFKVPGSALCNAILSIKKVTGCTHITITAEDGELKVEGAEKGKAMRLILSAKVITEGGFTVLPDVLVGVCRNRKDVEVTMSADESKVTVTATKYSADVMILPHEEVSVVEPEGGTELTLADAELAVLLDVCNKAQLTATYADGSALALHVNMTDKGTHVACLDRFHVASVRTRQITMDDELSLILPASTLATVASAAAGETYRILLSDTIVYADNGSFAVQLPMEQAEPNNLGLPHVKAMQDVIKKEESVISATVDFGELTTLLNNIFAVSEAGVPIEFVVTKGTLSCSTSTHYGSASEDIDAQVEGYEKGMDAAFKFNPGLLHEVLFKNSGDSITLHFLPKMLYIQVKNGETSGLYVVLRSS